MYLCLVVKLHGDSIGLRLEDESIIKLLRFSLDAIELWWWSSQSSLPGDWLLDEVEDVLSGASSSIISSSSSSFTSWWWEELLPPNIPGTIGWSIPVCSWRRQWILNQLDLRPYRDPDLDMPTRRHFRSRQALQDVRFFLLMTHWPPFLHSPMADTLLYVRPKKDCPSYKK